MSTTLGELIAAAQAATKSDQKSVPNFEEDMVGKRLSRNMVANGAVTPSGVSKTPMNAIPENSTQPYTLIDATALMRQPQVPSYPYKDYPLNPPPPANTYGVMGPYNSNYIQNVPNFPPPPAQQFINRVQAQNPGMGGQMVQVQGMPQGMYLPRTEAPNETMDKYNATQPLYGSFTDKPGFAGSVPPLKDAINNDATVEMKEGFRYRQRGYQPYFEFDEPDCMSVIKHVSNCPICSRYFRCDNKMYLMMMIFLVILAVLIFLILHKSKSTKGLRD